MISESETEWNDLPLEIQQMIASQIPINHNINSLSRDWNEVILNNSVVKNARIALYQNNRIQREALLDRTLDRVVDKIKGKMRDNAVNY
jgi:hypothetical protein